MSLTEGGVWAAGVWASTTWAQDVWFEDANALAPSSSQSAEYIPINAICDSCGFKYPRSHLRADGQDKGAMVCGKCYNPRHPQEYLRIRPGRTLPWDRPDTDSDSTVGYVDNESVELSATSSPKIITYNTEMTSNCSVLLYLGGAIEGDTFVISKIAGGAGVLTITGVTTVPASVNGTVVVRFNGSKWVLQSKVLF